MSTEERILILVSAGLMALTSFLAGCDQQAPAHPPGPTSEQLAKAKYEMDEKCAADTRVWFKANYPGEQEPIKVQGGGEIVSTVPTYQNHYSHKLNGCFALLNTMTALPGPHSSTILTNSIWDVNENRQVGVLVQKDFKEVTACTIDGRKCSSKPEFEVAARTYMVE